MKAFPAPKVSGKEITNHFFFVAILDGVFVGEIVFWRVEICSFTILLLLCMLMKTDLEMYVSHIVSVCW